MSVRVSAGGVAAINATKKTSATTAKMEQESEVELMSDGNGSIYGGRAGGKKRTRRTLSVQPTVPKKGPGRPRLPASQLKRPRRSRTRKTESPNEDEDEEEVPPQKRLKAEKNVASAVVKDGSAPGPQVRSEAALEVLLVSQKNSISFWRTRAGTLGDQLRNREAQLRDRDAQLQRQDAQIRDLEAQLRERDTQIKTSLLTNHSTSNPPTPAMSSTHSQASYHQHASHAGPTQQCGMANSSYMMNGSREASAISSYSDIGMDQQPKKSVENGDEQINMRGGNGAAHGKPALEHGESERRKSLIVTLRGDFSSVLEKSQNRRPL